MTGLASSDRWPYAPGLLGPELERYLTDAAPRDVQQLPARCPPWTVREVTLHLVCTFPRFCEMLGRGRAGDFAAPFEAGQLATENLRAGRAYQGTDPYGELRAAVGGFCSGLRDGDELMPHQLGPIPVALQLLFGLSELAIHHHDVAVAAGHNYEPPAETLTVLTSLSQRRHGRDITTWPGILRAAGRTT